MRAAEHSPRGPFRLLERRHGLAVIGERRAGILTRRRIEASSRAGQKPRDDPFLTLARVATVALGLVLVYLDLTLALVLALVYLISRCVFYAKGEASPQEPRPSEPSGRDGSADAPCARSFPQRARW